eukprot:PhM_4_TR3013/c0_g1_i1/m.89491
MGLSGSPRAILGTALLLLVVSVGIVGLSAWLYTDFVNERESTHLRSTIQILYEFGTQFEKSFTSIHGKEMADLMDVVSRTLEIVRGGMLMSMRIRMEEDAATFAALLDDVATSAENVAIERMLGSLDGLRLSFESATTDFSASLLQRSLVTALGSLSLSSTATGWDIVAVKNNKDVLRSSTLGIAGTSLVDDVCLRTARGSGVSTSGRIATPYIVSSSSSGSVSVVAVFTHIASLETSVCAVVQVDSTLRQSVVIPKISTSVSNLNTIRSKFEDAELLKDHGDIHFVRPGRSFMLQASTSVFPSTLSVAAAPLSRLPGWSLFDAEVADSNAEQFRQTIVQAFEHLNWAFQRTTELVVSRVDPETRKFDCQVTSFRFNTTCYADCYRTPQSCANAFEAYSSRAESRGITPDYRPEPVMGAFAWVGGDIQLALGIERDVLEIRGIAKDVLVDVFNSVNTNVDGSIRIHLVHEMGSPTMPTFSAQSTNCDLEHCYVDGNAGVLFRDECVDCMRNPVGTFENIDFYTTLNDCAVADTLKCRRESQKPEGAIVDVLQNQEQIEINTFSGYRGVSVYATGALLKNLGTAIFVFLDVKEVAEPARNVLIVCASIGIALACFTALGGAAPLIKSYIDSGNWIAPKDENKVMAVAFTDIQSSTNLWAKYPKEMGEALDIHNRVIRKMVKVHRGYEVKTIGDAFMVAFASVSNAVDFTAGVQLELDKQKWSKKITKFYTKFLVSEESKWKGLRVRIGLHCGLGSIKFEESTGKYDYYGSLVNVAARVESTAVGGQILVSGAVIQFLGEKMKYDYRSIGHHELKGVEELQELFQINPPGLEGRSFQSLATAMHDGTGGDGDSNELAENESGAYELEKTLSLRNEGSGHRAAADITQSVEFSRRVEASYRVLKCMLSTLLGEAREKVMEIICDRWSVERPRGIGALTSDQNPYVVNNGDDDDNGGDPLKELCKKVVRVVVETEVLDAFTGPSSETSSSMNTE